MNFASEGTTRQVVDKWVGDGIRAEEVPASVMKGKKIIIQLRPWCYLYNLVGYVLKYLYDLDKTVQLHHHAFIPTEEVHLKIGGDFFLFMHFFVQGL